MKRVTGLGGIFFKTNDPKKIKEWYEKHLGMTMDAYGYSFRWKDLNNPDAKSPALTAWSPFKDDTAYFNPSKKEFMFNYRVENLVKLIQVLKDEGVTIVGEIEEFPYGKFGWIMDPDGNKIELWEPIDEGFGE
jgi:predicted enzyme related to lactoylglutathione lyase